MKSYHLEVMLYELPVAPPNTPLGDRLHRAFLFLESRVQSPTTSPGRSPTRVDDYDDARKLAARGELKAAREILEKYKTAANPRKLLHLVLRSPWQEYVKLP